MTFVKKCAMVLLGIMVMLIVGRIWNFDLPVANVTGTGAFAVLTIFAMFFGAVLTPIVAFMAHFISDSLTYTTVWWTWIVADGVFGLMIGLIAQRLNLLKQPLTVTRILQFNVWQAIANILVWIVIAPLGDFLVYKSDWHYVLQQGVAAAGINFVMIAISGTLFILGYQYVMQRKDK